MSTCSDRGGFPSARQQRGDMMIEALVGVLITCVIGAGLAHLAAGMMNARHDARIQALAIGQLRAQLQDGGVGLCGTGAQPVVLPGSEIDVAVSCENATIMVAVAGIAHEVDAPQRVALEVAAADLPIHDATGDDPPLLLSSGK